MKTIWGLLSIADNQGFLVRKSFPLAVILKGREREKKKAVPSNLIQNSGRHFLTTFKILVLEIKRKVLIILYCSNYRCSIGICLLDVTNTA